jgi:hypothetical protein
LRTPGLPGIHKGFTDSFLEWRGYPRPPEAFSLTLGPRAQQSPVPVIGF